MDPIESRPAVVEAMRLGLAPDQTRYWTIPVTLKRDIFMVRADAPGECPLLVCLHPPRLTEYQFARKVRDLCKLKAHLVFPRGLHAHLVDLGGARTVGYDWCHYTGDNPSFRESFGAASDYLDRVMDVALRELPVDRREIHLLGSEGGTLFTSAYGVARGEVFASIITVGGQILPDLIRELAPAQRRVPFLCLNRQRSRTGRFREESSGGPDRIEDLIDLGFPVDHEILRGDLPSWEEEVGVILSWLTQKAGLEMCVEDA